MSAPAGYVSEDPYYVRRKAYRAKNAEQIAARKKEWALKNKDKVRAQQRAWWLANRNKQKEYNRKYHQAHAKERRVRYLVESASEQLTRTIQQARWRAKQRQFEFDEQLFDLAKNPPTHCACCGCLFEYSRGKGKGDSLRSASLDRVNNSIGYTIENVAVICRRCNARKRDSSIEDLKQILEYMRRRGAAK